MLLSSSLQAAKVTEQEIKAELVVRFLEYFDWQSEENIRSFHIGFLGSDAEFLSALTAATADRLIQGKTIQLFSTDYAEDLSKYQVLIVAASANTRFADITRKSRNTSTLVISDGVHDPTHIMINFGLSTRSTVTFEINKANILLEQLKMSNDILLLGGTELDVAEIYINASTALGNSNIAIFVRHFGNDGQSYGEQYTFKVNPDIGSVSDPRDGTEIYLSYDWDDRLDIHLRYLERTEEGFFTGLRSEAFPDDKVEAEKYSFFLKYRAWQTDQWRVDVSGSFTRSKLDSLTRKKTGLTSFQSRLLFEEQEWGLNVDARFLLNDHNELLFGIEWRNPDLIKARAFDNRADPGGDLVFTGSNRVTEGDRRILGIYLQQQYHFSENLELTLGIRNDDYSDFGGSFSPRAALVYRTDFDATFKVMYGEAFRAPSLRQSGSTEVGNPDLQPETVKTIEFAYIKVFNKLQTGITYFHSEYQDKITTVPRPTGPGPYF